MPPTTTPHRPAGPGTWVALLVAAYLLASWARAARSIRTTRPVTTSRCPRPR